MMSREVAVGRYRVFCEVDSGRASAGGVASW